MNLSIFVSVILAAAVVVLLAERIVLAASLKDVVLQLEDIINGDTNMLLTVREGGRSVKKLASVLNGKLSVLRKKELDLRGRSNEVSNAVTNIAHDLRTPLTAISGYLEMLENEPLNDEACRFTRIISERTESLRNLTEELFSFSLISSDENGLKAETVSLKSELETAIAAAYTILTDKNIEPVITLPDGPVERQADREALSRIFGNILSNASKYSCGDLSIVLDENGTIAFSNFAPELSETDVGRLFDRFFTVSDARTSHGIGLSIAKILTEKMNGEIYAEHKDGFLTIKLKL